MAELKVSRFIFKRRLAFKLTGQHDKINVRIRMVRKDANKAISPDKDYIAALSEYIRQFFWH